MIRRHRQTKIQTPETMTEFEFIKSKFNDWENEGKELTLGTFTEGAWQEYDGEIIPTVVRVGSVWEDRYVTLETLKKEYKFYLEQFEKRMMVLGV